MRARATGWRKRGLPSQRSPPSNYSLFVAVSSPELTQQAIRRSAEGSRLSR